MKSIVIIDDDVSFTSAISEVLKNEGFFVKVANDGSSGLDLVRTDTPDLVLLDIKIGDINGYKILEILKQREVATRVIIISVIDDVDNIIDFIKNGAADYHIKSDSNIVLINKIKKVIALDFTLDLANYKAPIINNLLEKSKQIELENYKLKSSLIKAKRQNTLQDFVFKLSFLFFSVLLTSFLRNQNVLSGSETGIFLPIILFILYLIPIDRIKAFTAKIGKIDTEIMFKDEEKLKNVSFSEENKIEIQSFVNGLLHQLLFPIKNIQNQVSLHKKHPESVEDIIIRIDESATRMITMIEIYSNLINPSLKSKKNKID